MGLGEACDGRSLCLPTVGGTGVVSRVSPQSPCLAWMSLLFEVGVPLSSYQTRLKLV